MHLPALNDSSRFRYFTFFYLYIMQGIPSGFALTAVANYLLGRNVETQHIGTFIAIVGLPWTIQFFWGPFIDRFQYSLIGHRKHWVVLSQLVAVFASAGLTIVKDPVQQLSLLSLLFFCHSIFASIQDASVDAMAISIVPAEQRGRLNGFMRGGFLIGVAFGSAGLSYVLHEYGFRSAAVLQTTILLCFTVLFFITRLHKSDPLIAFSNYANTRQLAKAYQPNFTLLFKKIYSGITNQKSLKYFGVVAGVYFCSSVFIRSYTYYLIHILKWDDKALSILQGSWGSVITFVAIILGGVASDKIGAKVVQVRVMWGVAIFLLVLNSSFYFWHYDFYSGAGLVLWNLADPLLSVAVFPILMGLCADKVEGSQFTAYMAMINLCDVAGSYLTGWSLKTVSAPLLGFCCGFFILIMILMLKRNNNYSVIPG
ncbi:MAG: MFS transporter [Ginsengibacter sp.]